MASGSFDLVIIGSGPAGYVAAVRAAQLGKTVACVERAELGGICLNWGCIPTKALIQDAHLMHQMEHVAPHYGLEVKRAGLQWQKIVERSRGVAGNLSKGIEFLFKKNKVARFSGTAFIPAKGVVEVRDAAGKVTDTLSAANILVCTGARSRDLPGIKPDGKHIITSREAMVLPAIPKRLLIIGAGAIGVEFAYVYQAFGSKVTLVEMLPTILPIEDADVSTRLEAIFKQRGIEVRTNTRTETVQVHKDGIKAVLQNQADKTSSTVEADVVLLAVGVAGNVENLFAPAVTPEIARGAIRVDKTFATNVPGIYAAGDVIGPPWLAHVASLEATIAVERMFKASDREMDYGLVPGCTYCYPQVASVGLTEKACKEKGLEYEVGRYALANNGKAQAIGETDGFVKLIFDKKYGELLGAHILGAEATEILQELVLAKRLEATKTEIAQTIHAHPTLSEAVMDAAQAAMGVGH
ncbi:MAG: dihydrolipoyl dehydrogenase [Phycisphaerales bacterium]|nr:dihydrolipoyl dehydrogenase [Phycisphaerales bacterium]